MKVVIKAQIIQINIKKNYQEIRIQQKLIRKEMIIVLKKEQVVILNQISLIVKVKYLIKLTIIILKLN